MQTVVWFIATLACAVLYGTRIRYSVGFVPAPLWRWPTALALSCFMTLGALVLVRTDVTIQPDVQTGLYAIVLYISSWLGLRYWVRGAWWDLIAGAIAFVLVGTYLQWPVALNNLMLVLVSLGASVAGYYATKAWARVLFAGFGLFDAYAVWGSDIMLRIMGKPSGAFPPQFFAMLQVPFLEVGTMDVILATLAVVAIQRHRGKFRSVLFALGCVFCVITNGLLAEIGFRAFQQMPFVVCMVPWVFLFLAGRRAPACS